VSTVVALLEDWEHWCCGERRSVGQEIELRVHPVGDLLYETRHPQLGDEFDVITGRIEEIRWRRAIFGRNVHGSSNVVGYEPGISISTTSDHPASDDDLGALEFRLDVLVA
jgi:hypothetical protein